MSQELLENLIVKIGDPLLAIRVRQSELAHLAHVAQSTVSKYIKKHYGSARNFRSVCLNTKRDLVIKTFIDSRKGNFDLKATLKALNLDVTKTNQILLQELLRKSGVKKKCKADRCQEGFFNYDEEFCSVECKNNYRNKKKMEKSKEDNRIWNKKIDSQTTVFDKRTKYEILLVQNFLCPLCGNPLDPFIHEKYHPAFMTYDHIEPERVGFEKRLVTHRTCNLYHGKKRINELSLEDYKNNYLKKLSKNTRPDLREFRMEFFSDVTVAKLSIQQLGRKYNNTYQNLDSLCTQLLPYKPHREPRKKKNPQD